MEISQVCFGTCDFFKKKLCLKSKEMNKAKKENKLLLNYWFDGGYYIIACGCVEIDVLPMSQIIYVTTEMKQFFFANSF